MTDYREVLRKVAKEERDIRQREFLAPYTKETKSVVVRLPNGMLYRFKVSGGKGSGIGRFRPTDAASAIFIQDASFEESRIYLEALPSLHVILAANTQYGWIAYPMNKESAKRKFGLDGTIAVRNVSDAMRFDVVTVRYDGQSFWYDEPFAGSDPTKSDSLRNLFDRQCRDQVADLKGLTPEDKSAFYLSCDIWNEFRKTTTEERIRELLESGGANMGSFVVRGENIEVMWKSSSGGNYISLVDKTTFDVVSAGICLNGTDSLYHLKDLPGVIREGEQKDLIVPTVRNRGNRGS